MHRHASLRMPAAEEMTVDGFALIGTAVIAVAVLVGVPLLPRVRPRPSAPGLLVSEILDALPGGNCGACGNGSCFGTAVAVAEGRAPSSVCSAGGLATAARVASVLRKYGRI